MVNLLAVVGVTVGLGVMVMAFAFFLWSKFRPKKLSWKAYVWKKSESSYGNGQHKLNQLQLYATDTIVREEKSRGVVVYKLANLNKSVPEPTPDNITPIPKIGKVIDVLYDGGSCTLLNKGYDSENAQAVWNPVPYDNNNALKNDMTLQLERQQNKKDAFERILQIAAVIISFMAIIGVAYMSGSSSVKISENNKQGMEELSASIERAAEFYRDAEYARTGNTPANNKLGAQSDEEG